jgi:hypothetical protein
MIEGMRRFRTKTFIPSAVLALCLVGSGCHHPTSREFAATSIQVIDSATKQPIVGATISTLCLGGTPYATKAYHTDARGIASVMYFARSPFVAVNIKKEGYQMGSFAVSVTNPLASLKRLQH